MLLMMMSCAILKILLIVALAWIADGKQTLDDAKTLRRDLLDGYDKFVRPIENQTQVVDVHFDFSLVAIQDFDEVHETISITGIFGLYWIDENFRWNTANANYSSIPYVYMGYNEVWVPELILTNPSQKLDSFGKEWQIIRYNATGLAQWYPADLIKATCSLDLRYFSFDIQKCTLEYYIWGYSYNEVRLITTPGDINLGLAMGEHGTWKILSTFIKSEVVGPSYKARISLRLERKSQYIIINIVLPILFMCILNVLVFILPAESGERVSYSISVLLAIAVFMTIVSDTLPKKSEPLPLISYFLLVDLFISAFASLLTILNLQLYHKDETQEIPRWLLGIYRLLACLCRRKKIIGNELQQRYSGKEVTKSRNGETHKFKKRNTVFDKDNATKRAYQDAPALRIDANPQLSGDDETIKWKDISQMFDYFLLTLFSLATVINFAIFLMITKLQRGILSV